MLSPQLRLVPIVAAGGLTLAACGGLSPEQTRVADTMTRAFHALAQGDGSTLCSLATVGAQRALAEAVPGSTCQQVVRIISGHLNPVERRALATVHVNQVTIHSGVATVRASDLSSTRGSLKAYFGRGPMPTVLRRQADGSWKLAFE